MAWRYGTWAVEHALPIGCAERSAVGAIVRAGDPLARGTIVGPVHVVEGARRVGVQPRDLAQVTRVQLGSAVTRGTVLARTGRRFARAATAPVDGRLVHVTTDGDFYIAPELATWTVRSTMDGVVERSDDACVGVEGRCWMLPGVAAYGPDAVGELVLGVDAPTEDLAPSRIDVRMRDRILVGGARMAAEAVTRAHACGVAGVVAGAAPAGGLRVVYGDDVEARGRSVSEDRPTVLCLVGFGSAPLPAEVFAPLASLAGTRAAIHTASARLFVFASSDAGPSEAEPPALVLAEDHGSIRALPAGAETVGQMRFASEIEAQALRTSDGAIPIANVLPFDAPR